MLTDRLLEKKQEYWILISYESVCAWLRFQEGPLVDAWTRVKNRRRTWSRV